MFDVAFINGFSGEIEKISKDKDYHYPETFGTLMPKKRHPEGFGPGLKHMLVGTGVGAGAGALEGTLAARLAGGGYGTAIPLGAVLGTLPGAYGGLGVYGVRKVLKGEKERGISLKKHLAAGGILGGTLGFGRGLAAGVMHGSPGIHSIMGGGMGTGAGLAGGALAYAIRRALGAKKEK